MSKNNYNNKPKKLIQVHQLLHLIFLNHAVCDFIDKKDFSLLNNCHKQLFLFSLNFLFFLPIE